MIESNSTTDAQERARLNTETGRIGWQELQRHFARGVVIVVGPELDLVDVAFHFVHDHQQVVAHWMQQGQVWRAAEEDARGWHENDAQFWAIVVAPWVVVQLIRKDA